MLESKVQIATEASDGFMAKMPISVTCKRVYIVSWGYTVSRVIKLKRLNELNKPNELF
jgi:hypothetical protein